MMMYRGHLISIDLEDKLIHIEHPDDSCTNIGYENSITIGELIDFAESFVDGMYVKERFGVIKGGCDERQGATEKIFRAV